MKKRLLKSPLVSVVTPVRNAQNFLDQAVLSVLNQTYKNLELIIINDASSDNSTSLIKQFSTKDSRIKVIANQSKLGVAKSLNKGIKKAKGRYIARMDADDIMAKTRLSQQVKFLQAHPDTVALGTWMNLIDEQGKKVGERKLPTTHRSIYQMMFYTMGLQHPTIMFNKALIPKKFSWYKPIRYAEDLDLIFRLLIYGKLANLPQKLHSYRIHNQNESLVKTKYTYMAGLKVRQMAIKKYDYHPGIIAQLLHQLSKVNLLLPNTAINKLYLLFRDFSGKIYEK